LGKRLPIVLEHDGEARDLGPKGGSGEAKEDNPGMRKPLVEDEFSEIAVGNDQDTLLFPGKGKNIRIRKAGRVVARDRHNVMAKAAKVGNEAKVRALVKKKFHTDGA
jgi:hypothetical protein